MNTQIVAILIAEGGKLLGHYIRNRPLRIKTIQEQIPEPKMQEQAPVQEPAPVLKQEVEIRVEKASTEEGGNGHKATDIATGCVPCAIGHIGTCSGLLNEAMRFARTDGMESTEVIDRMGICLNELNTMERVDLRPEMIIELPEWEKALANKALVASRDIRHRLEATTTIDELEELAATTQTTGAGIHRGFYQHKLKLMSPEDKERHVRAAIQRLEELAEGEEIEPIPENRLVVEETEENAE